MPTEPMPVLPPKLVQLLSRLDDRTVASSLEKVYTAASQAIGRLSDMDLVRYEPEEVEDSPNLSLWEEMAPVIRDTLLDVNSLLGVIREQVPTGSEGSSGATQPPAQRSAAAIRAAMNKLAGQISELGETMRSPQVMADRWRLLAEIQRFRTRFRDEIGALVYESASALGDVSPKDVPGINEELTTVIQLRAGVADLCRILDSRLERIREAEPEDVQWHAQQFQNELDAFGRAPAYRSLRAQDKRAILEFRYKLGKLASQSRPSKRELLSLAEPFIQEVRGFISVNKRQILVNHDRELLALSGVKLEGAEQAMKKDPLLAAKILTEGVAGAQALYGRGPGLDAFLRKSKGLPLITLKGQELKAAIDEFRELLAELPL